jgi:Zn ribbon nucleic-acid-binding protein
VSQPGLFDSCLPDRVQQSLEMGARIVIGKGVGMLLCPKCHSEKIEPIWSGEGISGHTCEKCSHAFTNSETAILTFRGKQ